MSTKSLHFKVSKDTGILLANIAQEHLKYDLSLNKALKVFKDSFYENCPQEIILDLLIGKRIITVDEEGQFFNVVFRKDYPELDKLYPKLDIREWLEKEQKKTGQLSDNLLNVVDVLIRQFRDKTHYRYDFELQSILDFIQGDESTVLSDLRNNGELNRLSDLVRVIKEHLERTIYLKDTFNKLSALYGEDYKFDDYDSLEVLWKFKKLLANQIHLIPKEEALTEIESFIDAQKEIDDIEKKGIEPVDMMDNYSAGWLSPDGTYYGLNGEIANMLHVQIADMLQKEGIIPEDIKGEASLDSWLERNGWVRQHGNWILYDGYNNEKLGKPNIPMTDIQKKMIMKFANKCYNHVLRVGVQMKRMTGGMFMMTEPLMMQKLFDF